jgi:hypothetical protein
MAENELDSTLSRILVATRADKIQWKAAQAPTRFVANLNQWRFRIETQHGDGDTPFKFSLMQPGSGKGEIAVVKTTDPDRPLPASDVSTNDALQELWELAGGQQPGLSDVEQVNELLDSII